MNYIPKILVVGSFVMDVIAATEQLPKSGQTVYGQSFHTACGGKGANQAVQCARLGADVTMTLRTRAGFVHIFSASFRLETV